MSGEPISFNGLAEPAAMTQFALQGNFILAGPQNPSLVATGGTRGAFYVQVGNPDGTGTIGVFQKNDTGVTTNWTPIAGGGSTNTVLNGVGAPAPLLGNNGDFYIDTATYNIYGPKTAGVWGAPTSLVGPAGPAGAPGAPGAPGTNGNSVLNGIVPPGPADGVNGDFWIDTATDFIYGPKAGGVWPAGVSLVGPVGPAGPAGASGVSEFVFQPGGATSGNIYATWAALYAALSAINGPKTVYIDDSIVSPAVIPASGGPAYNLTNCTIQGLINYAINGVVAAIGGNVMQLGAGMQWTGVRNFKSLVIDTSAVTGVVETIANPDTIYFENVQLQGSAATPVWDITASRFNVVQNGGVIGPSGAVAFLTNPGNYFIWNVGASASWPYKYSGVGPFNNNIVGGGAFKFINTVDDDVFFNFDPVSIFPNGVQLCASPKWQAFVPTTPGNWVPALAPAAGYNEPTVQQALDNLAARTLALNDNRETFALTAPQIASGVVLAHTIRHDTSVCNLQGAGLLMEGVGNDYTLSDVLNPGFTTVVFDPALIPSLVVGQKLQVQYSY